MKKVQSIIIIFCFFCPMFPSSSADIFMPLEKAVKEEKGELDFHKASPGQNDQFEFSTSDFRTKKTLKAATKKSLNAAAVQSAIWFDREGLSDNELKKRFPVSASEIIATRDLLLQLNNKKKELKQKRKDDSKRTEPPKKDKQIRSGRLYVDTEPKFARVRILNIRPKFYNGITLEPGKYHIEVSAKNCKTKKIWVAIAAGEKKNLNMYLECAPYEQIEELNKPFVTELPPVESIIDPSLIKPDISLPSIEPVIDPILVKPDVQSPSFDPVIDSSVNYYPKIKLPQIEPIVEVPPVEPVIEPPQIKPDIQLPSNIPAIEKPVVHPDVKPPKIDQVIELPSIEPVENLPSFEPMVEVPSFEPIPELPSFEPIPDLPDIKMHEIEVPDLKKYEMEMPDLKIP